MKKIWCLDPQSGGVRISAESQLQITAEIEAYAATKEWGQKHKLQIRYRGQFCYIGHIENEQIYPLGRLRYFNSQRWSAAFFAYSSERYEACFLSDGFFGTLEDAIDMCSFYLL